MDFLRQIVSGPKKRFQEDGYNLDLTYITPRIVAMSFPASGIETLYRNSIDNVSKLIRNKHNSDYLIVNLSGRKYDYSKFQDKVLDYQWEDHHSPPINTLFVICQKIHQFLQKKKENVAIIHCLAGKGRTGTIICCYMLYTGRFNTPQEALLYYGKKRFLQEGLGVNQPCQIRYVFYFHQILTQGHVYPTLKYIKSLEISGRPRFSDDGCRPFIEVISVHTKVKLLNTMRAHSDQAKFVEGDYFLIEVDKKIPISGDVLIRVKNNGSISNKNMFRFSFNTAFIKPDNELEFVRSELSPSEVITDTRIPKDLIIKVNFGSTCGCNCYTPFELKCNACNMELDKESSAWRIIYNILGSYVKPTTEESTLLLFGKEPEDIDEILSKEKKKLEWEIVENAVEPDEGENGEQVQKRKSALGNRASKSNFNEYMFETVYKPTNSAQLNLAGKDVADNQPIQNPSDQQNTRANNYNNSDSSSDENQPHDIPAQVFQIPPKESQQPSEHHHQHRHHQEGVENEEEFKVSGELPVQRIGTEEQRNRSEMSPNFYNTNQAADINPAAESNNNNNNNNNNVYMIYNNNADFIKVHHEQIETKQTNKQTPEQ